MANKFDKEARTFETRLLFIRELFSNPYEPEQILASSINHKLNTSLEQYEDDLHFSSLVLTNNNSVKVLTRLNKENK